MLLKLLLFFSYILICLIFVVLLRFIDEEVGRLVGEVKKKFEEKYYFCEVFREECLIGEKV